jgi:tetratricopeptide (TPR) repeat protein
MRSWLFLLALGLAFGAPLRVLALDNYEACLALVESDPAKAVDEASAWADSGGGPPARHCFCLALKQSGHYAEAAQCLEALAPQRGAGDRATQAAILAQAGNAWILQHEGQKAYNALSRALALSPDDPDMLLDRARAAVLAEDFAAAKDDLDRLVPRSIGPLRLSALILRANAKRELGDPPGARKDAEAALNLAPDSAPAHIERGIDRYLLGDRPGARSDWEEAVRLAPDSAAALDAQSLLQKEAQGALPAAPRATP